VSISTALATFSTRLSVSYTTRTGRAAIETTSATLPVATIFSTADRLAAEQDYDYPSRTRSVVVELKLDATETTYPAALETGLAAILALVAPDSDGDWLDGAALFMRETGAQFFHPDAGSNIAAIQVSIEIDYLP
jgi:hypothetical protein